MSSIKRNILANLFGRIWSTVLGLALVPIYVKLLGIEAYGLIGFFAVLQSMSTILDLGLGTTLNKEIARLSTEQNKAQEARDLVRTLETMYWLGAVAIAVVISLLAPLIAFHWVHPQHLSPNSVRRAVLVMGLVLALQFPSGLYSGGLLGLQQQVLYNGIVVVSATIRAVGTLMILYFVSRTIQAYFGWQIIVSAIQTVGSGCLLWKSLPCATLQPKFRRGLLTTLWRFAAGMAGTGVLVLLLTQMDKVILSKMLSLELFGYYNLATVVASGLSVLISPIFVAVFPRFSQLVALDQYDSLKELYHQSCQLMSVLIIPTALVVALFAPEVLMIWTHNGMIVERTHILVTILITGTALNGLMNVPYAVQLAYGWAKLGFYGSLVSVILLIPFMFWMAGRFGAVGAASVWIILNTGYVIISIQIMHWRLLKGEKLRWYWQDVGLPLLGAIVVTVPARLLFPGGAGIFLKSVLLVLVLTAAMLASASLTPLRTKLKMSLLR